jgi:hypothetical protein
MRATISGGKLLNDCPLKVTGAETGGGGGGKTVECVVEADGTLRSSGDCLSR